LKVNIRNRSQIGKHRNPLAVFTDEAQEIGAVASGRKLIRQTNVRLIALAAAMAKGYKSYDEYFSLKQQNPAYFLWKVQRNKN
jgi:hypothetical protein